MYKLKIEKIKFNLPLQYHIVKLTNLSANSVKVRIASSTTYNVKNMLCYPPHKPISRLLKISNEENP